jgi:hypothetical protein
MEMKKNIVINERERITKKCNSHALIQKHNQNFDCLLRKNGYPNSFVQQTYPRRLHDPSRNTLTNTAQPFYIKVPFVNDRVNSSLKAVFYRHGVKVRFYHQNRTMRNLLKKMKSSSNVCSLVNCPISTSGLCTRSSVVYKITCLNCNAFYIGSTIRQLHTRAKEHLSVSSSSVYQHVTLCRANIEVKILATDSDAINLRIKEALLIRDLSPQINSREELRELQCLI